MGWWSATIMGGDSPLDMQGVICDAMGVKYNFDIKAAKGYVYDRGLIEKHLDAIVAVLEARKWEREIGFQVLGVMVLETGAKISAALRKRIIAAAEADEWMKEAGTGSERGKYIKDFIAAMKAHKPGRKTATTREGLFEAFARKLAGVPG